MAAVVGRWRRNELDDIDRVAVDRAVTGADVASLTKGERFYAVVELHDGGMTYSAISRRLHIDKRQVHRYLEVAGRTSSGYVSHTEKEETG